MRASTARVRTNARTHTLRPLPIQISLSFMFCPDRRIHTPCPQARPGVDITRHNTNNSNNLSVRQSKRNIMT